MIRRIALAGLAVAALQGVAAAEPHVSGTKQPPARSGANVIERARLEVQPAGHPIGQITIDNALGDVVVEGYDGNAIQIETKKTAPDDEALDRLRISLIPNPDGTVKITTTADRDPENRPLSRRAVRIDLKVRAPRAARIAATSASGMLVVSNMDGGGDLETASGPIRVTNVAGELSTHSLSGATKLVTVFGSVDSQTLSSDLDLDSITGDKLVASANRGRIAGRRVRSREVSLTTMDGKIQFEGEALLRGHVRVASLKGDVDVRMRRGAHTPLVVRARAIRVDLGMPAPSVGDGWFETRLGAPSSTAGVVELRSRYGNVQFALVQ